MIHDDENSNEDQGGGGIGEVVQRARASKWFVPAIIAVVLIGAALLLR